MKGRRFLLIMLVLPLASAWAATADLDGLVKNSPFGAASNTALASPTASPLEFRGVMVDRGEMFFSVYDPATRASQWVGLKEPGNPFLIQSYDEAKAVATVEYQGRTLSLTLKQAKVAAAAPSAPNVATPATPPNAAPPTPSEDASRLAAVADEIRRRRALRAQAAQPAPAKISQPRSNP